MSTQLLVCIRQVAAQAAPAPKLEAKGTRTNFRGH